MTNSATPPSGTDIVSLGISVDATQPLDAAAALDKMSAATVVASTSIEGLEKKQQSLVVKLNEMVSTFGMSTEQILRMQGAQLGVSNITDPLVDKLETLKQVQFESTVQQQRDIEVWKEAARTRAEAAAEYEKFWQTELAAQEKAEAGRKAINQSRDIELNAMRAAEAKAAEKAIADQEAAAVAAAAKRAAIEEKRDLELNAMRQRANADYVKWWEQQIAIQDAALAKEIAAAEKAAVEEIKWTQMSVKARIAELEKLRLYQANSTISKETIQATFNPAAIKDLPKYEAALAAVASGQKLGKATANEFAVALDEVAKVSGRAVNEVGVLAHEVLQGRFSRMPGSLAVLAQYLDLNGFLFSGLGAAAIGAGVGIGLFGYEVVKGIIELDKLEKTLELTGNYAGLTRDKFDDLSKKLQSDVTGGILTTNETLLALVATGKFTSTSLDTVAQASLNFQHLSGESADKSAQFFAGMIDGVAKWVSKTNESYHFVTLSQLDHIRLLEEQGHQQEAVREAAQLFADSTDDHARKVSNLTAGYRFWSSALQDVVHWMRELVTGPDLTSQIKTAELIVEKNRNVIAKILGKDNFTEQDVHATKNPFLESQLEAYKASSGALRTLKSQAYYADFNAARKAEDEEFQAEGIAAQKRVESLQKQIRTQSEKRKDAIAEVSSDEAAQNAAAISEQLHKQGLSYKELTAQARDADSQITNQAKLSGQLRINDRANEFNRQLELAKQYGLKVVVNEEQLQKLKAAAADKFKDHTSSIDTRTKAELEDVVKPLERQIQGEAKALQERESLLKAQLEQGDVSLQQYLADEKGARDKAKDDTLAYYDQIISAGEKYIATVKDQTRRLRGETFLKEEKLKREDYVRKTNAQDRLVDEKDQKLVQDYNDSITRLNIQLDRLDENFLKAATSEEELTTRLQRRKANAGLFEFTEDKPAEIKIIDRIKQLTLARAAIQDQVAKYNLIEQKANTQVAGINLDVKTGKTDELSALLKIRDVQQANISTLYATADAYQKVAESTGNAKMLADADAFREKIDEMAASADVFAGKMNDVVRGPLETFFNDFESRSKSLKQAAVDLIGSIGKEINSVVSRELTTQILGAGTGGTGGFGAFISNLFGKGAGGAIGAASQATTQASTAALSASISTASASVVTMTGSLAANDVALQALSTAAFHAAEALATIQATAGGGGGAGGLAGLLGSGSYASWAANNASVASSQGLSLADIAGAFAGGGDPPPNVPSLVGEVGPELFVPKTSGTIISNQMLKNLLNSNNSKSQDSGMQVNQTLHFIVNGPITRETQAQIATATYQAASRAARRNG